MSCESLETTLKDFYIPLASLITAVFTAVSLASYLDPIWAILIIFGGMPAVCVALIWTGYVIVDVVAPYLSGLYRWWFKKLPEERRLERLKARVAVRKKVVLEGRQKDAVKHKRRQAAMQEIVVLEQEEREIYLGNITHSPTVEELDNRLGSLGIDVGALDSDTNSSSIIEC